MGLTNNICSFQYISWNNPGFLVQYCLKHLPGIKWVYKSYLIGQGFKYYAEFRWLKRIILSCRSTML